MAVQGSLSERRGGLGTSAGAAPRKPSTSSEPHAAASPSADVQTALFILLRQRLCSPTRPLPVRGVYDELANCSRVVEEFHFSKTNKRISRQCVALSFLRRYNVLLHSLFFFSENTQTWNVTQEFNRLALFGQSILVAEVRGRLLKLFPDIPYSVLTQVLSCIVGSECLARAFDRYDMKGIVGAKPQDKRRRGRFTLEEKCHMFCAVVGEMYWFVARTRPTDRTHNNALFPPSDVLILHVLCSHLLECIPAELIYRLLEPIIADMKQVWVNEPMSMPAQLRLVPRTIGALSLTTVPLPHPSTATAPAVVETQRLEAQSGRRPLTAIPETTFLKSLMQPTCNHRNFDSPRYQVLETDNVMEKPVLSSTREAPPAATSGMLGSEAEFIARAMELAKLALHN
jgi:hypothetical protein